MANYSVLVCGETLVDFLPHTRSSLSEAEDFSRRAGGAPANVAVGLSRLEQTPLFWTKVGRDPFGKFLARRLKDEGIPNEYIERDEVAKTSLAFVNYSNKGERFSFYRKEAADTQLEPGTVDSRDIDAVDLVYVGGVPLTAEPSRSATFDLLRRAAATDCQILFDPNYRPELWTSFDYEETVTQVCSFADLVKTSVEDMSDIEDSPQTPEAIAHELFNKGIQTVFVTDGDRGSHMFTQDSSWGIESISHPGFKVENIDVTGAGDAFTAGILTALADGETEAIKILEYGNAVAALSTTEVGAMEALPDRSTVRGFL
jgi:fructokinase